MKFKNVKISEWQQFESVNIEIHERLTVLTGANGSGKTTILNLLAKHQGWNSISLSTPKEDKNGAIKYFIRLFKGKDISNNNIVGELQYSSNQVCKFMTQAGNSAQYQLQLSGQQSIDCFYIPSHRPILRYQPIGNIPTSKKDKMSAFREVSNVSMQRYMGSTNNKSVSFLMKNTLIGWAINGYGVKNNDKVIMPNDREQIENFEGFQAVLRKILPKTLGFECIEIRNMEIVFVCNGGDDEFLLETASGGISALIDIAWQIFMYTSQKEHFTVLIDEVENHLHPTMQRTILNDLLRAFPNVSFIISTHSPLIVGSVKDSYIYALKYNEGKKIESVKLDLLNSPKTATEILDEVLGVSFTMPIWVEEKLNEIVVRYSKMKDVEINFSELRSTLNEIGLGRFVPFAITEIMEAKND